MALAIKVEIDPGHYVMVKLIFLSTHSHLRL